MGAHLSHHRNAGPRCGNVDDALTVPRSFNVNNADYKPEFDVKMKLRVSMSGSSVDNAREIDHDDEYDDRNNNNSKVEFKLGASVEDTDGSGRNTPVISRQTTPVISRQTTPVISHKNETVISCQDSSVVSQQNTPIISHPNTQDIWRQVIAEKIATEDEGRSELNALARVDEIETISNIKATSAAGCQISSPSPTPDELTNSNCDGDYEVGLLQEILNGYDHWEEDTKHGAGEENGTIKTTTEVQGKHEDEMCVDSMGGASENDEVPQQRCEPDGADDSISINVETNITTVLVADDTKPLPNEGTDTSAHSPACRHLQSKKCQLRQSKKWKSGDDVPNMINHKNTNGEEDTEIVTKAIRKIGSTLSNISSSTTSSMPNVRSINDMDEWMTWRMRINHQLASIVLKTSKPGLSLATKYPTKMSHTVIRGVVEGIAQEAPLSTLDRPSYLVYGIPRASVSVAMEQSRSDISR